MRGNRALMPAASLTIRHPRARGDPVHGIAVGVLHVRRVAPLFCCSACKTYLCHSVAAHGNAPDASKLAGKVEIRPFISGVMMPYPKSCVLDPRLREDDKLRPLQACINARLPPCFLFPVYCLLPFNHRHRMNRANLRGFHSQRAAGDFIGFE